MFCQFLGGAFFSAVAKTVFTSSIGIALHKFAPSIDPNLVINTGVTEISKVVPPDQLTNALLAYNEALNHVFVSDSHSYISSRHFELTDYIF